MKVSVAIAASAVATVALLPEQVDAHAFLLKPPIQFTIKDKNLWSHVVPGEAAPPFSAYTTGNADRNGEGFVKNYKALNPPSLKDFILKNAVPGNNVPAGGTKECAYSKMDQPALPLPDQIEFGNYGLDNRVGIHPGPCEAWCDDQIVVPLTMDCRTILYKPIPYDKSKCAGAKRLTFYWLATHFAPFQVYIGCAPLSGGGGGGAAAGGNGGAAAGGNGGAAAGGNGGAAAGGNNGGNKPAIGGGNNNNGGNQNRNNGANNSGGNNNNNNNRGNNNNNQNGNAGANKGRSLDFDDLEPAHVSTPSY